VKLSGDQTKPRDVVSSLDNFEFWFNIHNAVTRIGVVLRAFAICAGRRNQLTVYASRWATSRP